MRTLHLICLLPLLALSSCSWLADSKRVKSNRVGEVKVIGVVELVNPEQNYVLINCEQRLNIPAGTEIVAQNANGSKVKLKVTPERKGNYITADITDGTPQVRDLVLYQVHRGEIEPPSTQPSSSAIPTTTPTAGPAVPLTPVMQADVIPPLNAPFQPVAPVKPKVTPVLPPAQTLPPSQATPSSVNEPAPDLSKLPPVIR